MEYLRIIRKWFVLVFCDASYMYHNEFFHKDSFGKCAGRIVVGVIATNLSVAPSFHREVIVVVFSMRSGVFAVCVLAAGRVTSCLVMLNVLRKC